MIYGPAGTDQLYFSTVKERAITVGGHRKLVSELAEVPCFKGNSQGGISSQGDLFEIRLITECL